MTPPLDCYTETSRGSTSLAKLSKSPPRLWPDWTYGSRSCARSAGRGDARAKANKPTGSRFIRSEQNEHNEQNDSRKIKRRQFCSFCSFCSAKGELYRNRGRRAHVRINHEEFALKNTRTAQAAQRLNRAGGEYQVMTDTTELPRGSFFTALGGVPVESGDLVLFRIGRRSSVGRWLPGVGGLDWILQPGLLIACAGAPVRIVGKVVPCRTPEACRTGRIEATPGELN
jgi:hypothetical protein